MAIRWEDLDILHPDPGEVIGNPARTVPYIEGVFLLGADAWDGQQFAQFADVPVFVTLQIGEYLFHAAGFPRKVTTMIQKNCASINISCE
jgi:hypothetical protein